MTQIAIIGPGAVGGTVAAWLAQVPTNQVTLCARSRIDGLEVTTPQGVIAAQLPCMIEPVADNPFDWIVVATKAYDTEATGHWFAGLTGSHTRLAVLQNGVEHVERFAALFPRERILPAVVDCPAERDAPGKIRQRRAAWIAVPESQAAIDFKQLFQHTALEIRLTNDFVTTAWRKLCLNCAGAVSALVLKPSGVVHRDDIAELMLGLMRECVAVGRAEGAALESELPESIIAAARAGALDSINSMHADRLAGRQMEIEARNGVIVRRGRQHGIATPLNLLMVTLLSAAQ